MSIIQWSPGIALSTGLCVHHLQYEIIRAEFCTAMNAQGLGMRLVRASFVPTSQSQDGGQGVVKMEARVLQKNNHTIVQ